MIKKLTIVVCLVLLTAPTISLSQPSCDDALNACIALSTEQDKAIVMLKDQARELEDIAAQNVAPVSVPFWVWVMVGAAIGVSSSTILK